MKNVFQSYGTKEVMALLKQEKENLYNKCQYQGQNRKVGNNQNYSDLPEWCTFIHRTHKRRFKLLSDPTHS